MPDEENQDQLKKKRESSQTQRDQTTEPTIKILVVEDDRLVMIGLKARPAGYWRGGKRAGGN